MPEVVVRRVVAAPRGRLWDLATDLEGAPAVLRQVDRVEVLTRGPFGVGTRWRETRTVLGRSETEEMTVTAVRPGTSYTVEAESRGTRYRSVFRFTDLDGGATEVTLRFGATPSGVATRVLSALTAPLARVAVARALRGDLDDLAAAATR